MKTLVNYFFVILAGILFTGIFVTLIYFVATQII